MDDLDLVARLIAETDGPDESASARIRQRVDERVNASGLVEVFTDASLVVDLGDYAEHRVAPRPQRKYGRLGRSVLAGAAAVIVVFGSAATIRAIRAPSPASIEALGMSPTAAALVDVVRRQPDRSLRSDAEVAYLASRSTGIDAADPRLVRVDQLWVTRTGAGAERISGGERPDDSPLRRSDVPGTFDFDPIPAGQFTGLPDSDSELLDTIASVGEVDRNDPLAMSHALFLTSAWPNLPVEVRAASIKAWSRLGFEPVDSANELFVLERTDPTGNRIRVEFNFRTGMPNRLLIVGSTELTDATVEVLETDILGSIPPA